MSAHQQVCEIMKLRQPNVPRSIVSSKVATILVYSTIYIFIFATMPYVSISHNMSAKRVGSGVCQMFPSHVPARQENVLYTIPCQVDTVATYTGKVSGGVLVALLATLAAANIYEYVVSRRLPDHERYREVPENNIRIANIMSCVCVIIAIAYFPIVILAKIVVQVLY